MGDPPPVTTEEFRRLCEFLYRRTGMVFTEAKRYYVERRVRSGWRHRRQLVRRVFCAAAQRFRRRDRATRQRLHRQRDIFLPRRSSVAVSDHATCWRAGYRSSRAGEPMRIWSVPCSTGEEPYSIAMWLLENWPRGRCLRHRNRRLRHRYTACWKRRAQGIFRQAGADALLAGTRRASISSPLEDENWQIIDELRQSVRFSSANMVDPRRCAAHGRFDVIFCRNVLIYFDDASRRIAAENLYESLAAGRLHLPGSYRIHEPHIATVRGLPVRRCDRLSPAAGGAR